MFSLADVLDGEMPHEYFVVASISKILGILSLLVWLFAQIPQVLENHVNESVDGVSPTFLACWISGDVTNLVGCVLSHALPFQICLASYYCFIDVILTLQFWYYTHVYPRQRVHHNMLQSPNMMRPVNSRGNSHPPPRTNRFETSTHNSTRSTSRPKGMLKTLSKCVLSGSLGKASAMKIEEKSEESRFSSTSLSESHAQTLPASLEKTKLLLAAVVSAVGLKVHWARTHYNSASVGATCGWISLMFYLSSRAPQIWKNYHSKSTKGVSPFLFLFAMTGNTLYTVSIISDLYLLERYDQHLGDVLFEDVLRAQLPFIIGSAGTVLFDSILLVQFWMYRSRDHHGDIHAHASQYGHHYSHTHQYSHGATDHGLMDQTHYGGYGATNPAKAKRASAVHFTKPDWYTNNFPADEEEFHGHDSYVSRGHHINRERKPNDMMALMSLAFAIPPPHYISSSSSQSQTPHRRKGLSGTFTMLARSFSHSSLMVKSPSIGSSAGSVPASPMAGTALLPGLVGTYSSVSKKMMHDAKIPFLPSDFLNSDVGDSH